MKCLKMKPKCVAKVSGGNKRILGLHLGKLMVIITLLKIKPTAKCPWMTVSMESHIRATSKCCKTNFRVKTRASFPPTECLLESQEVRVAQGLSSQDQATYSPEMKADCANLMSQASQISSNTRHLTCRTIWLKATIFRLPEISIME